MAKASCKIVWLNKEKDINLKNNYQIVVCHSAKTNIGNTNINKSMDVLIEKCYESSFSNQFKILVA